MARSGLRLTPQSLPIGIDVDATARSYAPPAASGPSKPPFGFVTGNPPRGCRPALTGSGQVFRSRVGAILLLGRRGH